MKCTERSDMSYLQLSCHIITQTMVIILEQEIYKVSEINFIWQLNNIIKAQTNRATQTMTLIILDCKKVTTFKILEA